MAELDHAEDGDLVEPNARDAAIPPAVLEAVRELIRWAGDEPEREGLHDTPGRVARAFREYFRGYEEDPGAHARGRESPFEEAAGGVDARQRGAKGSPGKKLTRPAERYAAVEKLMADYGFSERRACRLIGVNRPPRQCEPKGDGDAVARSRLRAIGNERRRFGYRRLAIMLGREGVRMNLKKVYSLYREEKLTVRKRGGRKRALRTRAPMALPQGATSAGALISCRIHWPAAGAFVC